MIVGRVDVEILPIKLCNGYLYIVCGRKNFLVSSHSLPKNVYSLAHEERISVCYNYSASKI